MEKQTYTVKQVANAMGVAMVLYQRTSDKAGEALYGEEYEEHQQKAKLLFDVLNAFAVDTLNVLEGETIITDQEGKDLFDDLIREKGK